MTHGGHHADNNHHNSNHRSSSSNGGGESLGLGWDEGVTIQFDDERLTAVIAWLSGASSTMTIATAPSHPLGATDGPILHPFTLSLSNDTNGHATNGGTSIAGYGCLKLQPRDDTGLVVLSPPTATARRTVIESFFSSLPMLPQRLYAARKHVVSLVPLHSTV